MSQMNARALNVETKMNKSEMRKQIAQPKWKWQHFLLISSDPRGR